MKIALCFIISYDHILNKEEIWKEWIEPNKDIINVYFFYKDFNKIKSQWIREHTLPPNYIHETSYYHVIPAYLSLMRFALTHDNDNNWFCMLTDSCCPIISPKKFRYLFYNNYKKSIMSWRPAWWNTEFHKRANLALLPKEIHLANDPWFVLNREHVLQILTFVNNKKDITKTICSGGLANESLFAIILYCYRQLDLKGPVISAVTHLTDWSRMTSPTSPYLFKEVNEKDIKFIDSELNKNNYSMFIRKIAPEFPNEILKQYIYEKYLEEDNKLVLKEPNIFIYNKIKRNIYYYSPYMVIVIISYFLYSYLYLI
jgi:hypothetical protein